MSFEYIYPSQYRSRICKGSDLAQILDIGVRDLEELDSQKRLMPYRIAYREGRGNREMYGHGMFSFGNTPQKDYLESEYLIQDIEEFFDFIYEQNNGQGDFDAEYEYRIAHVGPLVHHLYGHEFNMDKHNDDELAELRAKQKEVHKSAVQGQESGEDEWPGMDTFMEFFPWVNVMFNLFDPDNPNRAAVALELEKRFPKTDESPGLTDAQVGFLTQEDAEPVSCKKQQDRMAGYKRRAKKKQGRTL